MDNIDLNALKGMWLAHKREEENARAMRLEVETAILSCYPDADKQLGGSITDADHGIKVTYKVTRTVDTEAVQDAWATLNENAQKAFRWKAEVDTKVFKAIQDLDPQTFATIAPFVVTKPAKPSIEIKEG